MTLPFMALCNLGKEDSANIDDYVERWHTGEAGVGQELREYLGFTKEEYVLWMKGYSVDQILYLR